MITHTVTVSQAEQVLAAILDGNGPLLDENPDRVVADAWKRLGGDDVCFSGSNGYDRRILAIKLSSLANSRPDPLPAEIDVRDIPP